MPRKRWIQKPSDADQELTARILATRGLTNDQEIESFLSRSYEGDTDPYLLIDMDRAVERLQEARKKGDKVVVYGDYDADGTTATALLTLILSELGLDTSWYVPNRFSEGYGLNEPALAQLHADGTQVVISVDCGIRAVETVEAANSLGLDIIVTDHHLPGPELPPALAIIDPNRREDPYPFKGLAGVGIAFKLAQGLVQSSGGINLDRYLDLVAIGTVADLAPLVAENRSLVGAGLEQLNSMSRPGVRALAEFAGASVGSITATSIGFGIGPRLNAAGRLADARQSVELLLATEGPAAWEQAGALDRLNRERQKLTNENQENARQLAQEQSQNQYLLYAADHDFHEGVIGLVAGRLVEEAYRPALVARLEDGQLRGSARSIPEFHITDALQACEDLLVRFGGHAQAAGFSVLEEHQEQFVPRISQLAADQLSGLDLRPELSIDASVGFDELGDDLMQFIDRLQPCGQANPYPVFATADVEVLSKRAVGQGGRHLKLTVKQAGRVFDAIAFGLGEQASTLPGRIELAYRLERNEFRGVVSLQLNVQDFRQNEL